MEKYVIIVAAGKGTRMGSTIPKQFLPLNGLPLVMHTIQKFYDYDPQIQIIVVLSAEHIVLWQDLCTKHTFEIPHKIAEGGAERLFSVKNALTFVPENALVAVHDGVRPFVDCRVIDKTFQAAEQYQSAIPVILPSDTIRLLQDGTSKTLDRSQLRLVQTPQCFRADILKQAYEQVSIGEMFTDDAGLVENKLNIMPHLVDGNVENIKITHPFDFAVAELLLKKNQ